MGNVIKIDDGSEVFDIVNKRGELLGQFTFIPSDFDIVKRYEKTLADFEAMQKELQDTPTMDEMKEIDRRMAESIDY